MTGSTVQCVHLFVQRGKLQPNFGIQCILQGIQLLLMRGQRYGGCIQIDLAGFHANGAFQFISNHDELGIVLARFLIRGILSGRH